MEKARIEISEERKVLFARLKEKYNPEGSKLRKYQLHLVETLKEFDSFCRKHEIVYYLAYGTLLGAVRHKGFIPWDDDADIWMDRENYSKLEMLTQGEYHRLSKNVYMSYGIRPMLWSSPYADIDIFVLDSSPTNKTLVRVKNLMVKILYALVKCRGRIDNHSFGKFKPYFLLTPIAVFASTESWKNKYKKSAMLFTKKGDMIDWLQSYTNVPSYIDYLFPNDENLWTPIEAEFDGEKFLIPKGYDQILRIIYGDYMQVPDESHIHVHGIVENIKI
mgnify:FL=1